MRGNPTERLCCLSGELGGKWRHLTGEHLTSPNPRKTDNFVRLNPLKVKIVVLLRRIGAPQGVSRLFRF